MVHLSYVALQAKLSGTEQTLLESLKAKGAIAATPLVPPTQGTVPQAADGLRKQETVSNIKMGEKLEVNGKYFYILGLKEEVGVNSVSDAASERVETRGLVYKGSIRLKANISEWAGQNLLYHFEFYSTGKLVKSIDFLSIDYRPDYGDGTEFITPVEQFDEIRLTVEPISDTRLKVDVLDKVEYVPSSEAQKVVDAIVSNKGNFSAGSMFLYNSITDADLRNTLSIWFSRYSGETRYPDGSVFRPFDGRFTISESYSKVVYELSSDSSGIGQEDQALLIVLPVSNLSENVYSIFLYPESSYIPFKIYVIY